jgi:hypothetical protein
MASNNSKISELTALTTVATGDKFPLVDISDTTDSSGGTTKFITWGELMGAPGAIGGTTANTIRALLDEDAEPTSDTLTANQCSGGLISNYGQTDNVTHNLPAAAAGYNFTVILGTTVAKYFRLDPAAGDSIYLDGVTTGDGKYVGIASAAVGAAIQFVAFQTGAGAYDWAATTVSGAWAAEA